MKPVSEYTIEDCDQALTQLAQTHDLERPITRLTDELDLVVNELAELLEQQEYLQVKERMRVALEARWGPGDIDTDLEIN